MTQDHYILTEDTDPLVTATIRSTALAVMALEAHTLWRMKAESDERLAHRADLAYAAWLDRRDAESLRALQEGAALQPPDKP